PLASIHRLHTVIALYPPLIVENLLPYAVKYEIVVKEYNVKSKSWNVTPVVKDVYLESGMTKYLDEINWKLNIDAFLMHQQGALVNNVKLNQPKYQILLRFNVNINGISYWSIPLPLVSAVSMTAEK